jgi:anthranilate phosphoribosyltransferase
MFKTLLQELKLHKNISEADAEILLGYILDDDPSVDDTDIVEMLNALSEKQPNIEEIYGFVKAMKKRMLTIKAPEGTIDTCGTGGDRSGTFNISTAAALLVAACDVPVAKHGNRAATSQCGSADVLPELGIPINLEPHLAEKFLAKNNFVFLFAPQYHPALKRLSIIRKSLGHPTIFNLLGPLLNPANVSRQVIGTFNQSNAEIIAEILTRTNSRHSIVINSAEGLDEAGLEGAVHAIEIIEGKQRKYDFKASDFGIEPAPLSDLVGGDAKLNAKIIRDAFHNVSDSLSAPQRVLVLNAALGLYVADKAPSIQHAIEKTSDVIRKGTALELIERITNAAAA